MSDPDVLLATLLAHVRPHVSAAAAIARVAPGTMTTVRIFPDPVRLEVARREPTGRTHVYEAAGDPELADLLVTLLNDGLAALPDSLRWKTRAIVDGGRGDLIAIVDVDAETVSGVLRPADDAADLVPLFTLRWPETVH